MFCTVDINYKGLFFHLFLPVYNWDAITTESVKLLSAEYGFIYFLQNSLVKNKSPDPSQI